jgi:hypothetical protein
MIAEQPGRLSYTETVQEPRVTAADRDYFRRLGEFERENGRELQAYLDSLPIEERLSRSLRRTAEGAPYVRREPDDLGAIYERARRLGLYRG